MSLRTMGGWQILAFYLLAWAVALVSPFFRGRLLLVPGSNLLSAHLLLMAALLTEAALSRDGAPGLGGPLGVAGLLAAASALLRDVWLLVGRGPEGAIDLLEECCARAGIATVREGGRLILKRHGTSVEGNHVLHGVMLVRFVRRRREPEVEQVREAWRRAVGRGRTRETR